MKLTSIALAFVVAAKAEQVQVQATRAPRITGIYSSLSIHAETLDVLGYELMVSRIGQNDYGVVLQCAEGVVKSPIVAHAKLLEGWLVFHADDPACGNDFRARLMKNGLQLVVDDAAAQIVPRHHSFWENHQ